MSGRFSIMRSLDPYHQRIGYLGAFAVTMSRGLDTKDAIRARLDDFLFSRIYAESEEYSRMIGALSPERRPAIDKIRSSREPEERPAAILQPTNTAADWVFSSEIWLHMDSMPSPRGFVSAKKLDRILDLARWTGLLAPTVELSETGFLLNLLIEGGREGKSELEWFNPLDPAPREAVRLMYIRLLLGAEILWPSLICELVERVDRDLPLRTRGENGLLGAAVDRFLQQHGAMIDPADILELKEINAFRASLAAKASTEENYLRPRLEILLDLGILERQATPGKGRASQFPWSATDRTAALATKWSEGLGDQDAVHKYLDEQFFGDMNRVFSRNGRTVNEPREILRWFAVAYQQVGRDVGFTPGRSVATLACLLAYEAKEVIEVSKVFDIVYQAARSEWSEFLRFSGGSRFDREFMIHVDNGLIDALDRNASDQPKE